MAEVSRCRSPIRYSVLVMTVAVLTAVAIWEIALLLPLRMPAFITNGGEVVVLSIALASVLTLQLMIESIAHERLVSDSFNPLAQRDSQRLQINQRVLQNTLEQLPLFGGGIAMICWLYPLEFRATLAATHIWILSRWVFWIGYHLGPQHRIAGLVGSAQSMIVLLGTLALLGWRLDGYLGATFVISVFSIGKLVIINGLRGHR